MGTTIDHAAVLPTADRPAGAARTCMWVKDAAARRKTAVRGGTLAANGPYSVELSRWVFLVLVRPCPRVGENSYQRAAATQVRLLLHIVRWVS